MARKVLIVGRDGVLVERAADGRVDRPDKVALVPGVIPALRRFRAAGYELVIATSQPGLGEGDYPRAAFDEAQRFIEGLFASQGVEFAAVEVCPHGADAGCACRKPGVGLLRGLLADPDLDRVRSAVVGDGESDLELARNAGLPGFRLGADDLGWGDIAHRVLDGPRTASVSRSTRETRIDIELDLDREADPQIETGIGFFDHMLEQLGKHGGFALEIRCRGDLEVDEHHTVEDVALALGQALKQALGDKRGIERYGFVLPMDEAQAQVGIDLGGRPYFVFDGEFAREHVGGLPTELVPHFFRSVADTLGAAIQIRVAGENTHHMVEACFKGFARALRQALVREGSELPSTKGTL